MRTGRKAARSEHRTETLQSPVQCGTTTVSTSTQVAVLPWR